MASLSGPILAMRLAATGAWAIADGCSLTRPVSSLGWMWSPRNWITTAPPTDKISSTSKRAWLRVVLAVVHECA